MTCLLSFVAALAGETTGTVNSGVAKITSAISRIVFQPKDQEHDALVFDFTV